MKKNLFYLFALICSMSLFTACSDDDEDNSWKQIPQTEISGSNATLKVNGVEAASGSVQMTVKNESEAVLNLKNVIPGYTDVPVNVELEKQADNTFKFAGATELNTAPAITKATESKPAVMEIEVDGTISLDGKVTVNMKVSGAGLYVGTYSGDKLSLKYSDTELLGKSVVYSIQGTTPVLTLVNVIPGEISTSIAAVYPAEDGTFSGEATTAAGNAVKYSGSLNAASGVLSLNVNVTLSDAATGGLAQLWPLSHTLYTGSYVAENSPFKMKWPALDKQAINGEQLSEVGSSLVSQILAEVLKDVTFGADGNLTATYYPTIIMGTKEDGTPKTFQDWMMEHIFAMKINVSDRDWLTSPKNLAFWYTKDSKLYIVLNLEMILKTVAGDGGTDLTAISELLKSLATADDEQLAGLMAQLANMDVVKDLGLDLSSLSVAQIKEVLGWLTTGIPLNYELTEAGLHVYVDKTMVSPFMPLVLSMMPTLQAELDKLAAEEPMIGLLPLLLGIEKLTDFQTIWNENTSDFELGINFSK